MNIQAHLEDVFKYMEDPDAQILKIYLQEEWVGAVYWDPDLGEYFAHANLIELVIAGHIDLRYQIQQLRRDLLDGGPSNLKEEYGELKISGWSGR